MRAKLLAVVLSGFVSSALLAATTPAETFHAFQKAAEARDADAMAKLLAPEEREAFFVAVRRDGITVAATRVPTGALTITSESDDIVAAEADKRPILFVRDGTQWFVAAIFAKPEPPVAKLEAVPSVRGEKGAVIGVAPIRGAGMSNEHAINAVRAYEVLLSEARDVRPAAKLYSLNTAMYGLSAEGTSSGWLAEFSTDTPGELLRIVYVNGEIEHFPVGSHHLDRPGVPEPDALGYDTKRLYEEALQHAAGVVDSITRISVSLYRSVGSGKALWLLNVYGDDDRIGQTVVFDATTLTFSHKTKD